MVRPSWEENESWRLHLLHQHQVCSSCCCCCCCWPGRHSGKNWAAASLGPFSHSWKPPTVRRHPRWDAGGPEDDGSPCGTSPPACLWKRAAPGGPGTRWPASTAPPWPGWRPADPPARSSSRSAGSRGSDTRWLVWCGCRGCRKTAWNWPPPIRPRPDLTFDLVGKRAESSGPGWCGSAKWRRRQLLWQCR